MKNTSEHTHHHDHSAQSHSDNPLEIAPHNHRAVIGFDKNGVPKVLLPVSGEAHTHVDAEGHTYTHTHHGRLYESSCRLPQDLSIQAGST